MSEISEIEKAVDKFAEAMKARMISKAKQGWSGWRGMERKHFDDRLLWNAAKAVNGDKKSLVDVANFAMMIYRHK
jgi:hypothetical protein